MNDEQLNVIKECGALSLAGQISFGEVVGRLSKAGVERYHADYARMETTYYLGTGESHVVPMGHEHAAIGQQFEVEQVQGAVRQAQRGEIQYPQFIRQTMAAGCVGYFAQLVGQRVQYFGRSGEVHTEWFPGAQQK
jgi:uncharacterized protein YbcV (DUF1398 family)